MNFYILVMFVLDSCLVERCSAVYYLVNTGLRISH